MNFDACCGVYLSGDQSAPTAEHLMRSRYTAYTQGNALYLLDTWHPDTRPSALQFETGLRWTGLQILATFQGREKDEFGTVHFKARYKLNGKAGHLEENSRFQRLEHWYYVDGDVVAKAVKPEKTKRRP